MSDTIFALSSGPGPAAVSIVRVSGPAAGAALRRVAGRVGEPRRAGLARLHDPGGGALIDRALTLWFPGPGSATGEDLAEFHIHGGRAVAAALLRTLGGEPGLRPAEPGEFTRRAFENGVIDLAEAEGLADLLAAETESQRLNAVRMSDGALSRMVEAWQSVLLGAAAQVEAALDFSDEEDVEHDLAPVRAAISGAAGAMEDFLRRPAADRLRDGVRVVIGGPPNTGKSTLLNALVGREAAIVTPSAGTTRDLLEAAVAIEGVPMVLIDSAGLRDGEEAIEQIGIARAMQALNGADIILWLGEPEQCPWPERAILVHARADLAERAIAPIGSVPIAAQYGEGLDRLVAVLVGKAKALLPLEGEVSANARQRQAVAEALECVTMIEDDPLLLAEQLRNARLALDRVTGRAGIEDMLDALFGRFCIGK